MFSIANLLDSARSRGSLVSDYQLAKVIEKNKQNISGYRHGKTLPDEGTIVRLCQLSGDDPDLVAAQIQSERAQTHEGRLLWARVAQRLAAAPRSAGHVQAHMLVVLFAVFMLGGHALPALASAVYLVPSVLANAVYYVKLLGKYIAMKYIAFKLMFTWPRRVFALC